MIMNKLLLFSVFSILTLNVMAQEKIDVYKRQTVLIAIATGAKDNRKVAFTIGSSVWLF